MKDFLAEWLKNLLAGRSLQDWKPNLYASADVVKALDGELSGIKVEVDDTLAPGTFTVWGEMARYEGVRTDGA